MDSLKCCLCHRTILAILLLAKAESSDVDGFFITDVLNEIEDSSLVLLDNEMSVVDLIDLNHPISSVKDDCLMAYEGILRGIIIGEEGVDE